MDSGLALRAARNDGYAMLDAIYAIKFVHMIAMAAMFGTWLALALFSIFARRSNNTSVVALTALFVFRVEMMVMIPAVALQPLAGFLLAAAIGASATELWLEASSAVFVVVLLVWLFIVFVEYRIRAVSQEAALASAPLPDSYRQLFRLWSALTALGFAGMIAIMALMIWQPHWS